MVVAGIQTPERMYGARFAPSETKKLNRKIRKALPQRSERENTEVCRFAKTPRYGLAKTLTFSKNSFLRFLRKSPRTLRLRGLPLRASRKLCVLCGLKLFSHAPKASQNLEVCSTVSPKTVVYSTRSICAFCSLSE